MTEVIEDSRGKRLFERLFSAHPSVSDPVQRRVACLMAMFHLASIPVAPTALYLVNYTKPTHAPMSMTWLAVVVACATGNYILARSPWYQVTIYAQVIAAFVVCYWTALIVPTRQSVHFLVVLLPVLMASYLMSFRELKLVTFMSFLGLGSLYLVVPEDAQRFVVGSAFAVSVLCVLIILIRHHHSWVESVRREKLAEEYERFQSLMEAAYDTTLTLENRIVTQVDSGASDLFLLAPDAILGQPIDAFLAVSDLSTEEFGETTFKRGDGRIGYASYAVEPLSASETFIALRDVTEAQLETAQQLQLDRMTQTATLAAGIAHEFNTPLMVTMNQLRKAGEAVDSDSEVYDLLQSAQGGLSQLSGIVKDLKWFIQPSDDPICRSPGQVMDNAIRLAGHRISHQSQVVMMHKAEQPLAIPDSQLTQLLLNLLFNANEAKPEGVDRCTIEVRSRIENGCFQLSVADDGIGMSPEVHSRAFQPFFTHGKLAGTGLGLAICHSIVSQAGGNIELVSNEGEGTTVIIHLPLAHPSEQDFKIQTITQLGEGVQLVIDDDPLLSELVAEMLDGPDTRSLNTVADALSIIDTANVDLILCDLNMPHGGAQALFRELTRSAPRIAKRLIVMTGGAVDPHAQAFLKETQMPVLYKPFGHDELCDAVDQIREQQSM